MAKKIRIKGKTSLIIGWLFISMGILVLIGSIAFSLSWNIKKNNYNKEYVYNDNGTLYYEKDGNTVNVKKVFNSDNAVVSLNIPNKETAIMYCSKTNNSECLFFEPGNVIVQGSRTPIFGILGSLLLISFGLGFIPRKFTIEEVDEKGELKVIKGEGSSIFSAYFFLVFISLLGLVGVVVSLQDAIRYTNLKKENNITVATVYSQLYDGDKINDNDAPVAYYYVNDKKYTFVNYSSKNVDLGKTFEIYYDKNNPQKAVKKGESLDVPLLFVGLAFFIIPLIFLPLKKEDREILKKQKARIKCY